MRRIKLAALITAPIFGSFLLLGWQHSGIVGLYSQTLSPMMFALWMASLICATLAPPVVALAFWWGARRTRHGWLLHALLVPVIVALVRGSVAFMLFAADEPDTDGLTGWATDPAVLLMVACPLIYFVAIGLKFVGRIRSSVHGR